MFLSPATIGGVLRPLLAESVVSVSVETDGRGSLETEDTGSAVEPVGDSASGSDAVDTAVVLGRP